MAGPHPDDDLDPIELSLVGSRRLDPVPREVEVGGTLERLVGWFRRPDPGDAVGAEVAVDGRS